jgi:hypothetical protein
MKKSFLFLFSLGIVFAVSFLGSSLWEGKSLERQKSLQNLPSPFTLKNQSFTIVIIGHNNGASVAKTLSSVFSQNYENYRVVYIDDYSDDGSYDLAHDLIYDSGELMRVTLVQNQERLGELANLVRAVQGCQDDEIVVVLQGEDRFSHEWVLQRLNAYYADPDTWMTLAQYCNYPSFEKGDRLEMGRGVYRGKWAATPHLKSFYASLFKKVRESDFSSGGKMLPEILSLAYIIPMVEMAGTRAHFIDEVLYIHNTQVASDEVQVDRPCVERFIGALTPYPELSSLMVNACSE